MKNVIAVAVASLGLTAGAIGLATAAPDDSTTSSIGDSTTTTTAPDGPKGPGGGRGPRGLLGRAISGDLIVRGQDGFEPVTFNRGTLTAVDAASLTLRRPDGVDVTVKLDDQTRYRGVENAGALQKDKPVVVFSKDGTAKVVMQRDPEAKPGRRGPGRPGGPPPARAEAPGETPGA